MGYYTNFEFGVQDYGNKGTTDKDIVAKILEFYNADDNERFYPLVDAIDEEGGIEFYDDEYMKQTGLELFPSEAKWYSHDEDMGMLAKAFPDVTFKLSGDGEESDDVWVTYYKGNQSYSDRPKFPEFNPVRLDSSINGEDKDLVELLSNMVGIFNELKEKFPNTWLNGGSLNNLESIQDLEIRLNGNAEVGFGLTIKESSI